MNDRMYLQREKPYYKGNIHAHSTVSDGRKPPAEVAAIFKKHDYNFIVLSEHNIYTRTDEYDSEGFIVLPGMEKSGPTPNLEKDLGFHLGAIDDPAASTENRYAHRQNLSERAAWSGMESLQEVIDDMQSNGNLVVYNHPEWSMNHFQHLEQLNGYFALEIYNQESELNPHSSYGTAYWDYVLRQGKRVFGVAADDSHAYDEEAVIKDFLGGWVMVQAAELTHQAIVGSLKQGCFYSSTGPEIYALSVEDGSVKVECSECKFIQFKSFEERGNILHQKDASPITAGQMKLPDDILYVRVECVGFDGNVAWSNPIFVDDLCAQTHNVVFRE